jgi:hypothetical protein
MAPPLTSLTISNTRPQNNGAVYTVVVSGACGVVTSSQATLTVNQPIAITVQPLNQVICSPNVATLSVTASGNCITISME